MSAAGFGGDLAELLYVDMADAARGGSSSRELDTDPFDFAGRGLDPLGRAGRFVRRSFK